MAGWRKRERSGVKERRLDADAVTCLSSWNCLLVSDAPAAARYDGDSYWPHKYMGIKALRVIGYRHYRLLPTKRLPSGVLLRPSTILGAPPSPPFFTGARLSPERERSALPDQAASWWPPIPLVFVQLCCGSGQADR